MGTMIFTLGTASDDFPQVVVDDATNRTGHITNCAKSVVNGDILTNDDQWETLTSWNAGLSCQITLKPKQCIVMDCDHKDFHSTFQNAKSNIKEENAMGQMVKSRQFLVYELPRGTAIPVGVGIERDGDNHVCLYPLGDHSAISRIKQGEDEFSVDILLNLVPLWRKYALIKIVGGGYQWPNEFPPDSKTFPVRRWVEIVVMSAPADLAISIGCSTMAFVEGDMVWSNYFKALLSIGERFALSCAYHHCIMTKTLMISLKFALDFDEFEKQQKQSFMLKSSTFESLPAYEQQLVESHFQDLDIGARAQTGAHDGNCFVSATASVDILFINSVVPVHNQPRLPFSLLVDDKILVFDQLETRPVYEAKDNEADSIATHVTPSYTVDPVINTVDQPSIEKLIVEATADKSFEVELSPETVAEVLSHCLMCFGHTLYGIRCKNKRKPVRLGEAVWCHHHRTQEMLYARFLMTGERPPSCVWWENANSDAFSAVFSKMSSINN